MPKLRKMLGNVTDPVVQSLMGLIETQSRSTLAHWAVNCAAQRYLPIYESAYPEDSRLRNALSAVQDLLPVSYTHLDVYKRQPLRIGNRTSFTVSSSSRFSRLIRQRASVRPAGSSSVYLTGRSQLFSPSVSF